MNHSSNPVAYSFTVGESYAIARVFFLNLWPLISVQVNPDEKGLLWQFFTGFRLNQKENPKWNEAVYRLTTIETEGQQAIHLFPSLVLECVIEFCKGQDSSFLPALTSVIYLLESMKTHPNNHLLEWSLWEQSIQQALTK